MGDFITGYVGSKSDQIEQYAELNSGGDHPLIERIDFDRVMARLDESGQTYMAMAIRNDDPLVIQNLVVGKGIDGAYQRPMIFTYTMTEAFYQTYLNTGSLEGFEGTVHRVYLDPDQIRQNENVANMALSSTTTTNCPDQSSLGGKDEDPNTAPDTNPDTGGGGTSGAGCTYEMQTVIEEVEEYVTTNEEVDGQMWLTTTIVYSTKEVDKMVMTCDDDWASLSTADTNCDNPDDGEVPIVDQVLLDSSFVSNSKLMCIWNKLTGTAGFQNKLKAFDGDMSLWNIQFSAQGFLDPANGFKPSSNAITRDNYNPNDNLTQVIINTNSDKMERPILDIARTLLHEAIHAEIYRQVKSSGGLDALTENNFPGLFDYYSRYGKGKFQHQLMAKHYIDFIAENLGAFDNYSQNEEVYTAMAWQGLRGYSMGKENIFYVAFDELSDEVKIEYDQLVNEYLRNNKNDSCN